MAVAVPRLHRARARAVRCRLSPRDASTPRAHHTYRSTFRGTLKYESLAGTKFDVPDVSSLPPIPADEFASAAIDSLVADSKAVRRSAVDVAPF